MRYLVDAARARGLDKIAIGYTVSAWAVVQGAALAASAFLWPAWVLQAIIVLSIVGLPAILIGVWGRSLRTEGNGLKLGRADLHLVAVLAVFLVIGGGLLVEVFWPRASIPSTPPLASEAPSNSIAVLPFANTSGDPHQQYFSDGISEELIGRLARNPALRVAARTSSFFFEGKNGDVRSIAQRLNVRTVLEGSVRTANGHVRIEADLIDAHSGYQLWSESYDRAQSDILFIQEDIAQAIARALVPALTHAKPASVPKAAPIDPQVYRDYLQAQVLLDQRLSEGETPQSHAAVTMALQLFRKVAAQAPDFADGQASLAYALLVVGEDAQVAPALQRALALDPKNPLALYTAALQASGKSDWDTAIDYSLQLKNSNAHSALAAHALAVIYENFGLTGAATREFQKETQLDPFSYPAWAGVVRTYFEQARYQDAINTSAQALALHPDDPVVREYDCVSLASLNRIPEAKKILATLSEPGVPKFMSFHCNFFITLHSRGAEAAIAWVHSGIANDLQSTGGPGDIGFMLSHAPGAFDTAVGWYDKSMDQNDFGFNFYPGQSPPPEFFKNPRWIAFTQRPEYRKWEAARERARALLDAP